MRDIKTVFGCRLSVEYKIKEKSRCELQVASFELQVKIINIRKI
jgi:hypothetical protein